MEWQRQQFIVTDQRAVLNDELIHRFLSTESYWAKGIAKATVVKSLDQSLCFGLFEMHPSGTHSQIGLGRVITDRTTFAYLADVFVLQQYRGQGLGKWLVDCILSYPDLQGLRRWMLATGDAHEFYRRYGFTESPVGRLMEKVDAEFLKNSSSQ